MCGLSWSVSAYRNTGVMVEFDVFFMRITPVVKFQELSTSSEWLFYDHRSVLQMQSIRVGNSGWPELPCC